jgi:bifunctional N-acetylglucosamine-1-phosphate-uridyltransferase/glucosamine-1-phosphate-acetyltransferase GlmU-like protein
MHSVIILAGGIGKRMMDAYPTTPKVCVPIKDKPMIVRVLQSVLRTNPKNIYIVVGKYGNIINETINCYITNENQQSIIKYIKQGIPLGTGHAIQACVSELYHIQEHNIIILCGDVPLTTTETLNSILNRKDDVVVTTEKENPFGMGRIINKGENVIKIIEEKDCSEEQRAIKKVNCGIYKIMGRLLFRYIYKLENNNAAKEYYLTDIIEILHNNQHDIYEHNIPSNKIQEVLGVNTIEQLCELESYI